LYPINEIEILFIEYKRVKDRVNIPSAPQEGKKGKKEEENHLSVKMDTKLYPQAK